MMIGDDQQQQQDDQQEHVCVLGEDFQPPAVVNVDVSEDLLAAHVSRDKKTLFLAASGIARSHCVGPH